MRKIFLFMNVSLDGFFEDANHDISGFKSDFEAFSVGQSESVDTILLGHRTYNMFKSFWSTPQAEAMAPDIARFMNERRKVVASHQDFDPGWKNVTVLSQDVPAAIRKLKDGPGQDLIMMGSNTLCVSLMEAGLVDQFQILLNPVAFGSGTPLFKGLSHKVDFTLTDSYKFGSGNMLLTYVPLAGK